LKSTPKSLFRGLALGCLLLMHPPAARATQAARGHDRPWVTGEVAYDTQNPFARIIRGELPAYKVYEDGQVLAFLSKDQSQPGHVLVISRTSRAQNIMEMSPQDLTRVMLVAQRIARAEVRSLHADGVEIRQNNGAAANQTVFHLHVHVIPRWDDAPPEFARNANGTLDRPALAARIAAAIRD
jgi:diadenosine tetraphosphate (Ap4A) HIT family hydrolase